MPGLQDIPGTTLVSQKLVGAATAGTAIEEGVFIAPFKLQITAVRLIAAATITGQATNFFTLNVRNRTTGAGTVVPATLAFSSAPVVATANTPLAITLSATATDLIVAAGDAITCEKAITGTGLAMPAGLLVVSYVAIGV